MSEGSVYFNDKKQIRSKLIETKRWLTTDIDKAIGLIISSRTMIRKHIMEKSINDKLLVNNCIVIKNILGYDVSRVVFSHFLTSNEMFYIDTVYEFLGFNIQYKTSPYFHMLLLKSCYEHKKKPLN